MKKMTIAQRIRDVQKLFVEMKHPKSKRVLECQMALQASGCPEEKLEEATIECLLNGKPPEPEVAKEPTVETIIAIRISSLPISKETRVRLFYPPAPFALGGHNERVLVSINTLLNLITDPADSVTFLALRQKHGEFLMIDMAN